MAIVLVHKEPHLPSWLSSTMYFGQRSNGAIIPTEVLYRTTKDHTDELAALLRRPNFNHTNLDSHIIRDVALKPKQQLVQAIRKSVNVVPLQAGQFWAQEDVRGAYGPYAVSYGLMTECYVASREASRQRDKAKAQMPPEEEKEAKRKHINEGKVRRDEAYRERKKADTILDAAQKG